MTRDYYQFLFCPPCVFSDESALVVAEAGSSAEANTVRTLKIESEANRPVPLTTFALCHNEKTLRRRS